MSLARNIAARDNMTARLRHPWSLVESCLARYGSPEQVDLAISDQAAAWASRLAQVEHSEYLLHGGPFDGQTVQLSDGSTCDIAVGYQRGHYTLPRFTPLGRDLYWSPDINSKESTNDTL